MKRLSDDLTVSPQLPLDAIDEIDETLEVSLTLPTGGVTIADGTAVVTIVDDDTAELSIVDLTFGEADGTVAAVRVTLSGESSRTVSVSFATSGVSAAAGSDYQFASGVLTWAAGDVGVRTADVQIIDDGVDEADEPRPLVRLELLVHQALEPAQVQLAIARHDGGHDDLAVLADDVLLILVEERVRLQQLMDDVDLLALGGILRLELLHPLPLLLDRERLAVLGLAHLGREIGHRERLGIIR